VKIRAACAAGAAAAAATAVWGPLDRLAGDSFAWHMVQHAILLFAVPALALLARPFDAFARVASKPLVAAVVRRTRPLHALASPVAAYAFFVAVLWGTHFTALYGLALRVEWVHALEHLLYVAAGTLFWIPVLAPAPLRPLNYPIRVFYLVAMLPQGALLGAAISSARAPLYAHYAALMPFGRALSDQRDAAAVMWAACGLVVFSAMIWAVAAWAAREAEAT
jgi:putative membrane protein